MVILKPKLTPEVANGILMAFGSPGSLDPESLIGHVCDQDPEFLKLLYRQTWGTFVNVETDTEVFAIAKPDDMPLSEFRRLAVKLGNAICIEPTLNINRSESGDTYVVMYPLVVSLPTDIELNAA